MAVEETRTGWCALYLIVNVEYHWQSLVDISAIGTKIRSFEYLSLNMQICNYTEFDRVQSWHGTNRLVLQHMWSIMRIEWSTCVQLNRRYVDLNILDWVCKTAITLDLSRTRADISQTNWCALFLVANVEYNAHRIIDISAMQTAIRWFE